MNPLASASNTSTTTTASSAKATVDVLMQESIRTKSQVPISTSNIGYKLLSKLGYSGSGGLGRLNQGTATPTCIQLRSIIPSAGVGVLEARMRRETAAAEEKVKTAIWRHDCSEDFKRTSSSNYRSSHVNGLITKCKNIAEELGADAVDPLHPCHDTYQAYSTADDELTAWEKVRNIPKK
jgi:hypothetical protein